MRDVRNMEKIARDWISENPDKIDAGSKCYCKTRDMFQSRHSSMLDVFLRNEQMADEEAYIIAAVVGEIGNNSFDHNLGNWPDVPGVFFCYDISDHDMKIVLADRGQGILKTLKAVKPELATDSEALNIAFTERISGRAPENRGNGLKFVRENVKEKKMRLIFVSGRAHAELNDRMEIKEDQNSVRGCLAVLTYSF